jgi:hypothetical protein
MVRVIALSETAVGGRHLRPGEEADVDLSIARRRAAAGALRILDLVVEDQPGPECAARELLGRPAEPRARSRLRRRVPR